MSRAFEPGDTVYGLWPGSALYYKAIVKSYDPVEKQYNIEFESTDEVITLPKRHVVSVDSMQPKRGRSQSPSRKKSPARRRSTSRSRSKRGRSPSPARTKKVAAVKKGAVLENSQQIASKEVTDETVETVSVEETKVVETNVVHEIKSEENNYRARLRSFGVKKEIDIKEKQEEKEAEEKAVVEPQVQQSNSFGALFLKSLVLLGFLGIMVLLVPTLYLLCSSKQHCTVLKLPVIPEWQAFFKLKSFYVLGGWISLQVILFCLPVGKLIERKEANGHFVVARDNGIFCVIVSVAVVIGAQFSKFGKELTVFLINEYLSLLGAGISIAFLWGFMLLLFTRCPPGVTCQGTGLSGFLFGKQQNPSPGSRDWKLFTFLRLGFLNSIALNFAFIAVKYHESRRIDPVILFIALTNFIVHVHYLSVMDYVVHGKGINESNTGFISSFMALVLIPYLYLTQIRYAFYFHTGSTPWKLAGYGILLAFGAYLFISTNYQKMLFRKNPKHPCFKDADFVVTADGRNLLASGWWGKLRHPNYTGDILMAIGAALPCGFSHFLPWLYPLYIVVLLSLRAVKDDQDCAQKHGKSWEEYRKRVKYSFIPFVL